MKRNNYSEVEKAKQSFEKIMDNPKYSEIIRDDKHLETLLKMTDIDIAGDILDIGTGLGYLAFPLAKIHTKNKVIGIDITPNIIEKNRLRAEQENIENIEFISFDGINYPFETSSFDLIVTRYAFHHFPDIEKTANQLALLLNTNGYILISDPIRNENDKNHIIDKFMSMKGDGHIQFYTPAEIEKIFNQYGVVIETNEISNMKFPFPPKQEYIDLFISLSDEEVNMYHIYQEDHVVWVGNINVANILLRKEK